VLEFWINKRLEKKDILLMAHTILGYPSLETSMDVMRTLVDSGADILELQIPFTDPVADGPLIVRANERAIKNGASVVDCLALALEAARDLPVPVVVMSYYNVAYRFGLNKLAKKLASGGVAGILVPDLPPEEANGHFKACRAQGLATILTVSPTTPRARLSGIASNGQGFVYCIARRGVTGSTTHFSTGLSDYIARCRNATHLPLAVGFGVAGRGDMEFLRGRAEIAVVGTELLRRLDRGGLEELGAFVRLLQ
jgi:tryptophan synthase alpha chain